MGQFLRLLGFIMLLLTELVVGCVFFPFLIFKLPSTTAILAFLLVFIVLLISSTIFICTRDVGWWKPNDSFEDGDRCCLYCFIQWALCSAYTISLSIICSMTFFLVMWVITTVYLVQEQSPLLIWNCMYLLYVIIVFLICFREGYKKLKFLEDDAVI